MSFEKKFYIIAGCNGAGKTTAARLFLPESIPFINADIIAFNLRSDNVESVAFESGRRMLLQIDEMLHKGVSFAIETTLSTRSYHDKISLAHLLDYKVILLFFWLNDSILAIERVRTRVMQGGHNIENEVIVRRYKRGIDNLLNIYIPLIDELLVFDNSESFLELIAEQNINKQIIILNFSKWNQLMKST